MGLLHQVLLDSPIGYWPLDETSGTTARDRSGNGRDGTYNGGVTLAQSNQGFVAPLFNGTSGYVSVPDPGGVFLGHPFTAEIWARSTTNGYRSAFAKNNVPVNNGKWNLRLDSSHHATSYMDRTVGGSALVATYSGRAIDDGVWHHLAFSWDGTTNTLYLDGVAVATASAGNAYMETSGTANLTLGAYDSSGTEYWTGHLAHAACFASVLTAARIKAHYQAGARRAVSV